MTRPIVLATFAGWPRPYCAYTPGEHADEWDLKAGTRALPAPWIGGSGPIRGDWLTFRGNSGQAHSGRLCAVCGEPMNGLVVLGRMHAKDTSGPGCHPRCAALAVHSCPHFKRVFQEDGTPCDIGDESATVAYVYCGPGVGYCHTHREGIDDLYSLPLKIDGSAKPLTRSDLRGLAKRDPMGVAVLPLTGEGA